MLFPSSKTDNNYLNWEGMVSVALVATNCKVDEGLMIWESDPCILLIAKLVMVIALLWLL